MARVPVVSRAPHDGEGSTMDAMVGYPDLLFDGAPFPFATVGDFSITIPSDGIVTMTVDIAVTLAVAKNDDDGKAVAALTEALRASAPKP